MKIALLAAGVAADLFDTFEDHWHSGEASGLKTKKIYALINMVYNNLSIDMIDKYYFYFGVERLDIYQNL